MTLSTPVNNRAEVLHTLIQKGCVSIQDYPYLSGFRTRVSELSLRYSLTLDSEMIRSTNKFGNNIAYKKHILPQSEQQKAVAIYNEINRR
jgi:hypothetical protein